MIQIKSTNVLLRDVIDVLDNRLLKLVFLVTVCTVRSILYSVHTVGMVPNILLLTEFPFNPNQLCIKSFCKRYV